MFPAQNDRKDIEEAAEMNPESEELYHSFAQFCLDRQINDELVPVEHWGDLVTHLQNIAKDVPKANVIIHYIKSVLDNTYELERTPKLAELLQKIASQK